MIKVKLIEFGIRLMKPVICFFIGHKFITIEQFGKLEVKECSCCSTHLNIHHGYQESFISRKYSLLSEIREMKKLFREIDKEELA